MSRRSTASLILTALFVLLLAACQPATAPTLTPAPAEIVEAVEQQIALRDTSWTVLSYGVQEEIPVIEGSDPSVNFLGIRYSGFTGCNFYLGTLDTSGADPITMKAPAVTTGFCDDPALFEQEQNFLSVLTGVNEYRVEDDRLVLLYNGTPVMTLDPLEPVPFEGTAWNYLFMQDNTIDWLPLFPGTSITAVFEGDTVSGSAGCNEYTATFTRSGNELTISDVISGRETCTEPEGIMDQENLFLQKLAETGGINQFARSFELRDTEGLPLMLFSAD